MQVHATGFHVPLDMHHVPRAVSSLCLLHGHMQCASRHAPCTMPHVAALQANADMFKKLLKQHQDMAAEVGARLCCCRC